MTTHPDAVWAAWAAREALHRMGADAFPVVRAAAGGVRRVWLVARTGGGRADGFEVAAWGDTDAAFVAAWNAHQRALASGELADAELAREYAARRDRFEALRRALVAAQRPAEAEAPDLAPRGPAPPAARAGRGAYVDAARGRR